MTIEELIKRRKKLGIKRSEVARMSGYSYVWFCKIEKEGERRVSQAFLETYKAVLDNYERMLKCAK